MTESRLAGLTQLRHVELLERALAFVPNSRGYREAELAAMTRDQLICYLAERRGPRREPAVMHSLTRTRVLADNEAVPAARTGKVLTDMDVQELVNEAVRDYNLAQARRRS